MGGRGDATARRRDGTAKRWGDAVARRRWWHGEEMRGRNGTTTRDTAKRWGTRRYGEGMRDAAAQRHDDTTR
jgi:hypothetical protein